MRTFGDFCDGSRPQLSIYETDAGECFPDPQAAVADAKTASDMAKRELAYYEAARERHFGKR